MRPLIWIAVPLMLIGAVLLVTDVGPSGRWIAVIAVGIAMVAIDRVRARQAANHGCAAGGNPGGRDVRGDATEHEKRNGCTLRPPLL
jgi:hypothetical protein